MALGGPVTILGGQYLQKMWRGTGTKLKTLVKPLVKDGIGDRMDRGNLWVVPGFTLLVFAVLWATKLSKVALEESTCKGASIYDFAGTQLDTDAIRHCQTAKRYYVGPTETISLDQRWRAAREVKNPEWILWFWAPIIFVMYVLTRFMWSLLLENQGINFANVVSSAQSVTRENDDGIMEVDDVKLSERLNVIAENFRCAYSSRAFTAFVMFELTLVVAPMVLLLFILPLMIGGRYRYWGLDIGRAWWEKREWQGTPLSPFFDLFVDNDDPYGKRSVLVTPLIPRYTFCDYNFVSLGNSHTLTYRCYLDANWHERTALFTWCMLLFLSCINLGNLFFWVEWAVRMRSRSNRRKWVVRKWLNPEGFSEAECAIMMRFAEEFNMSQLLLFYYIEAHTDRVVASAFCTALFARHLEKKRQQWEQRQRTGSLGSGSGGATPGSRPGRHWAKDQPPPAFSSLPQSPIPGGNTGADGHQGGPGGGPPPPGFQMAAFGCPIGWNLDGFGLVAKHPLYPVAEAAAMEPTAPPISANTSFSDATTPARCRSGRGFHATHSLSSVASSAGNTPKSTSAGVLATAAMIAAAVGMPEASSTAALIGRCQGRLPNVAAEVGRDSCFYCRRNSSTTQMNQQNLQQQQDAKNATESEEAGVDGVITSTPKIANGRRYVPATAALGASAREQQQAWALRKGFGSGGTAATDEEEGKALLHRPHRAGSSNSSNESGASDDESGGLTSVTVAPASAAAASAASANKSAGAEKKTPGGFGSSNGSGGFGSRTTAATKEDGELDDDDEESDDDDAESEKEKQQKKALLQRQTQVQQQKRGTSPGAMLKKGQQSRNSPASTPATGKF